MQLNKLSLRDQGLFNRYLGVKRHELSCYAFENIYIWKGLFDIFWAVIEGNLCIFFKDGIGCFLYLPPLGKKINRRAVEESFRLMDKFNPKNRNISRIENVEGADAGFYRGLGYEVLRKDGDYLCARQELAQLKGNKFKHKRACCNYFAAHYEFDCSAYSPKYKDECFRLYRRWMQGRKKNNRDALYCGMLEDSGVCLKILLENYRHLDFTGKVIKINKKIKAFSFGFELNKDSFCILYEMADLSVRGLSQFIFREFCRQVSGYKYINIMDDSGLENLKKTKLSYRPLKLIPAYVISRKK